jgi:indolepyruvate ferredoxin oxidoreductase beta subunit
MIVLDRVIPPVSGFLPEKAYDPDAVLDALKSRVKHLTVVEAEPLIKSRGGPRALNVALLGVVLRKNLFPFTGEDLLAVMREKIPPRFLDINLKALFPEQAPHE